MSIYPPKTTIPAAYACGLFTAILLYFIAMPIFGGWCISYRMEGILGTLSLIGVIGSGMFLLPKHRSESNAR